MLKADDYERIYRAYGKQAADAEFDRQMRKEHRKIALTGAALCVLLVLVILTS